MLDKLIEALRHELRQYGEMLALLEQQGRMIDRRGEDGILQSIADVDLQRVVIQAAHDSRHRVQQEIADQFGVGPEAAFDELLLRIPSVYQPLLSALVEENHQLLERVQDHVLQNQAHLRRCWHKMAQVVNALHGDPDWVPLDFEPSRERSAAALPAVCEAAA
jgi:hypothetical protein